MGDTLGTFNFIISMVSRIIRPGCQDENELRLMLKIYQNTMSIFCNVFMFLLINCLLSTNVCCLCFSLTTVGRGEVNVWPTYWRRYWWRFRGHVRIRSHRVDITVCLTSGYRGVKLCLYGFIVQNLLILLVVGLQLTSHRMGEGCWPFNVHLKM